MAQAEPLLSAVPESKYKPKAFSNKEKYVVGNYQYPSDLLGLTTTSTQTEPLYGGNYAIFYINVNNDSRMVENPTSLVGLVDIDASDRVKKQLSGREYSQEKVVAAHTAQGAGVVGIITGSGSGSFLGGAAAAVGASTVAMNTKASTFSRPQKRLKTVIALHIPNQLSIRYGAGWSEEETFAMQALIQGGEAVGRALIEGGKALANKDVAGAKAAVMNEVKGVSAIVANATLQGPSGSTLSALTGLAPNPMKEQIFKGVDFRSFSMEYQFAPRNLTESKNVNDIIKAFKYHMHPEYKDGSDSFLFIYPSEFDIVYYHGGKENLNIHRHTSCVLTELNINYTPNGTFSTFKDGYPTQINVTMTFKELTILTKELIEEGL